MYWSCCGITESLNTTHTHKTHKPISQYDADLGVTSGASGVNGVADDRSQFNVPSVCTT